MVAAESTRFATIVRSDGHRYTLTEEDVLWAARSAAYEGGDTKAGLSTTTQRYMLPAMQEAFPSYTAFIRTFSAPISPHWARDGKFCRPGGDHHGTAVCSERILARRDEAQSITWAELRSRPPYVLKLTEAWAHAELPNPVPRATNFAAPSLAASYLDRHPGAKLILKAGNWYLAEPAAVFWNADHVTMQLGDRIAGPEKKIWPWFVGLIALASGGYFVHQWWSKR